MQKSDYQFYLEMLTKEGESLGKFPTTIDWAPACEHLHLQALRRGETGLLSDAGDIQIEPIWDEEKLGAPYASGARLTRDGLALNLDRDYFKSAAVELSGELVEKKLLSSGESFFFRLIAHHRAPAPEAPAGLSFSVRATSPPLHFIDVTLASLKATAVDDEYEDGDFPVFIPQSVLDEMEALTRAAGSNETGGMLVGNLTRDAAAPEIALMITAFIPAQHTASKTTSLTFTADTWTAVQAALDLRQSQEMLCGWAHSHPSYLFCKADCPPEKRAKCALQKPFLSSDDLVLHRTVFAKAFHVALLANHADAGLGFALYGWRRGMVHRRGYHVLGAPPASREHASANTTSTGEMHHATL